MGTSDEQVRDAIVAEGLDPDYTGMPAVPPSTGTPWLLYILFAVGLYLLFSGGESEDEE